MGAARCRLTENEYESAQVCKLQRLSTFADGRHCLMKESTTMTKKNDITNNIANSAFESAAKSSGAANVKHVSTFKDGAVKLTATKTGACDVTSDEAQLKFFATGAKLVREIKRNEGAKLTSTIETIKGAGAYRAVSVMFETAHEHLTDEQIDALLYDAPAAPAPQTRNDILDNALGAPAKKGAAKNGA